MLEQEGASEQALDTSLGYFMSVLCFQNACLYLVWKDLLLDLFVQDQLFVQQLVELLDLFHSLDYFGVVLFFQQGGDMAQGTLVLEIHADKEEEESPDALSYMTMHVQENCILEYNSKIREPLPPPLPYPPTRHAPALPSCLALRFPLCLRNRPAGRLPFWGGPLQRIV